MIREDHITVEIAGEGAKPDTIGVSELMRILSALESGISTVSIEGAPDIIAERLAEAPLEISLVDVEEGNSGDYWARLHYPEQQLPAFETFSLLISGETTAHYPPAAVAQAEEIAIVCRREGYTVSMSARTNESNRRIARAEVTPESKFEVPEPTIVRGKTVIFGEIERVGGREPKVVIRMGNGETIIAGIEKRSMASALGERLYQKCGIEGTAEWRADTEEMTGFTVSGMNEYAGGSISSAMGSLRNVVGSAYDDIEDVPRYVRSQRDK